MDTLSAGKVRKVFFGKKVVHCTQYQNVFVGFVLAESSFLGGVHHTLVDQQAVNLLLNLERSILCLVVRKKGVGLKLWITCADVVPLD